MRLILGMILGAALTIGGAYVSDSATKAGTQMVNWDVVAKNFDALTSTIKASWSRLTDGSKSN